jgi:hypothetical protein
MKAKIKKIEYNIFLSKILAKNIIGITLCPFGIYYRNFISEKTLNHENIHWQQQLEMLIIFFYLWYGIEWLIRKIFVKGDAYRNLSFEREAYQNDHNEDYLKTRKKYSWLKYLKKSKQKLF